MRVIDCVQGETSWYLARLGIPTSSCFDKIITTTGKRSASREKYMYQLSAERIAGRTEETYQSAAMLKGVETESEARQLYEVISGKSIVQVGFCVTEGDFIVGASPDGLIDDDGLLEIKCPKPETHVSYLMENKLPTEYFLQVNGQLFVTGRAYVDFCSYYPGIKPFIIRVEPNKQFQSILAVELQNFCSDLTEVVKKIGG
jgi:predicted phage-related endonuclease